MGEESDQDRASKLDPEGATGATWFDTHERAHALAAEGRFVEAIELGSAALVGLRAHLGDDDPQVAVATTNLASYYAGLRRWSEALPVYEDGMARKRRLMGKDHPSCAATMVRIARFRAGLGDPQAAMSTYRSAIAIFSLHPDANPALHLRAIRDLGAHRAHRRGREHDGGPRSAPAGGRARGRAGDVG